MEYNKSTYAKANDKKVLHKIRKHWVVVSTALLMALGGGAVATTHASAHADANSNNGDADTSSTQTAQSQPKATLTNQSGQKTTGNNNAQQNPNNQKVAMPSAQGNDQQSNSNQGKVNLNPNIEKQAAALHAGLLGGAAQNQQQFNADQTSTGRRPKMMLGDSPASTYDPSTGKFTNALDNDGLYPQGQGYTKDSATGNVYSDDSNNPQAWNSDAYEYEGTITVRFVDPNDKNFQVGSGITLYGSDGTPFNNTDENGTMAQYIKGIPPLAGPYGTGYQLVNSNPLNAANFDTGKNISKYIGGENQYLTINVEPKPQVKPGGQVLVDYQNYYNHGLITSTSAAGSDATPFDQNGYLTVVPTGYKTQDWTVSDQTGNNAPVQVGGDKATIQNFDSSKVQILHVYLVPNTTNDAATVKYVNDQTGQEINPSRTIFGKDYSNIKVSDITDYVPSGYTFDNSYDQTTDGQSFSNGLSNDNPTFTPNNGTVVYVAVKPGSPVNPQPLQEVDGTINVHYQTTSNGVTKDVDVLPTVEKAGTHFNMGDYTGNTSFYPDGYTYAGTNNPNGVSTYGNNDVQNVYVNVKQSGGMPAQVTNAWVQYMAIDPNDPSATPQEIGSDANNHYTLPLFGQPGSSIDYTQYTNNPPAGYVYVRMGNYNTNLESNEHNIILVEGTQAPKTKDQLGAVQVNYVDVSDGNKLVYSIDYAGKNGTDFSDSTDWTYAQQYAPSGYVNTGNTNISSPENYSSTNVPVVQINVTRQGANPAAKTSTINIEYDAVKDPDDLSKGFKKLTTEHSTGNTGTNIDYLPFLSSPDMPASYTFYRFGNSTPAQYEPYVTAHILVMSQDHMPAPITVNYVNQSNQPVDDMSAPDDSAAGEGQPIDEEPLFGNLGETLDQSQIIAQRPVPEGYYLAPNQDVTATFSNVAHTVTIRVNGDHSVQRTLKVHRVFKNSDGNTKIGSDDVMVPVNGNNGDIVTYQPSDFAPNPKSYYAWGGDYPESVELTNNGLVQGNSTGQTLGQPLPNGELSFDYYTLAATAHVQYEDQSDGDQPVSEYDITDKPGLDTSSIVSKYHLTTNLPSGYKLDTTQSTDNPGTGLDKFNPAKLLNGETYVVYVQNSNKAGNDSGARQGYGYIAVHYQEQDKNGNWVTVATQTASGKDTNSFNKTAYETATTANGYMPDAYVLANPAETVSDGTVTAFNKNNPQVFNIHVTAANSSQNTNLNKPVQDLIKYEALNSDGSVANADLSSTLIEGLDGHAIPYDQYTHNVPAGYTYAGMGSDIADYTAGNAANPTPTVATIYVKLAKKNTTNTVPNYNPSNTSDVSDGHGHTAPNSGNKSYDPTHPDTTQTGNYFPWTFPGNSSDAPLDGPENPSDPITANGYTYNSDNPKMPDNYEYDQNGVLPAGYLPAWVPKDPQNTNPSDYVSGYVPSDDIPGGYEPGFVPNGKGGFVPGFIPTNPDDQPGASTQTNGGKKIPKFVPGVVPNGKKGANGKNQTTAGMVPDTSPYATDTASSLIIQYVNAKNPNEVIQSDQVDGSVGKSIDLSAGSKSNFLIDLPAGYSFNKVLGQVAANGKTYTTENSSDNFDNIANPDVYGFSDTQHTVKIALNHLATGTVEYVDADKPGMPEVGSTTISGIASDNLDFTPGGKDYKYLELVPYNFHTEHDALDSMNGGGHVTLNNGGVYVIEVHESKDHNAPAASNSRKGYGMITINYYDAAHPNYIIGTDQLMGKDSTSIPNSSDYTKTDSQGGYIPYGYDQVDPSASANVNTELSGDRFTSTPQTISINVDADPNETNTSTQESDQIVYKLETSDGSDPTMTVGPNGTAVPAGQPGAGAPMEFTVTGDAGSTIDYSPYKLNVPSGYYYAGMGTHSTVIDAAHSARYNNPEVIYVKKAQVNHSSIKNAQVVVYYKDNSGDAHDPHNGQQVGSVVVFGANNQGFETGYYEDNAPKGYTYNGKENLVDHFNSSNPQTETIDVKPSKSEAKHYGVVTVTFKDVSTDPADPTHGQVVGTKVATNPVGSVFDPDDYEFGSYSVSGYDFDDVESAVVPRIFNTANQNLVVDVTPSNND